jgi:SAM-dependent methyltransferase
MATAHQYRRLYELVARHLPEGASVLDWGCGNGHVSYGLHRLGYRVSGYSFEDFGLRRYLGEDYHFERGTPEDPSRLPFEDESFDGVMSVGVLEHVRETGGHEVASLQEIARVLKPGGAFLCYHFPNRYSLIETMSRRIPSKHSHPFRYTQGDIESLCRCSGLDLVETRRYGALPRNFWHRSPASIGDSPWIVRTWDALDTGLGAVLSPWCQNYLFVARKPTATGVADFGGGEGGTGA